MSALVHAISFPLLLSHGSAAEPVPPSPTGEQGRGDGPTTTGNAAMAPHGAGRSVRRTVTNSMVSANSAFTVATVTRTPNVHRRRPRRQTDEEPENDEGPGDDVDQPRWLRPALDAVRPYMASCTQPDCPAHCPHGRHREYERRHHRQADVAVTTCFLGSFAP